MFSLALARIPYNNSVHCLHYKLSPYSLRASPAVYILFSYIYKVGALFEI